MADVVVPTVPPLTRTNRVELIHTGTWTISTGTWNVTREDLIAAVAALDCPAVRRPGIKLGHSLGQEPLWAGNPTGEPTIGWVDNLTLVNDGHTLIGDYVEIPHWLGQVMASAYPDRSVEGTYDFRCQIGHTHPFVLTAVALLGATPPGVATLRSLQDVARLYGATTGAVSAAAEVDDEPLDPAGDDDPMVEELLWALAYVAGELDQVEAAWNPANHPRWPKGTPGGRGGQFRSQLAEKIKAWLDGDHSSSPFDGFTREQLRRAAKRRGITLKRGAVREEIAAALMESARATHTPSGDSGQQPATGRQPRTGVGIGRDLTGQDALPWDSIPMGSKDRRHEGDKALGRIYEAQGFHARPDVGSDTDVDAVVDAGGIEMFRGVSDYPIEDNVVLRADDFIEQFKRGDQHHPGFGVFGNGTYTSTEYGTALQYTSTRVEEQHVTRMALKPDARIVDWRDLIHQSYSYEARGGGRGKVLANPGRLAAALGYDAMRVQRNRGEVFYVIFNRGAVIVQDTPAERFRNLR